MNEPILEETSDRFTLFPIKHFDIWELYKKALSSFWTAEEIDFTSDIDDWNNKLNDNERFFIKNVLAFFAASDGIVNENLAIKFYNEVQVPEIRNLYASQIQIEAIHSECVTGDTLILTENGYFPIGNFAGQVINVWNGNTWTEVLIENKGFKRIYEVFLSDGTTLKCSAKHKWILEDGSTKFTEELKSYDAISTNWVFPRIEMYEENLFNPRKHATICTDNEDNIFSDLVDFFYFEFLNYFNFSKYQVPINCSNKIKIEWLKGVFDSKYTKVDVCVFGNYTVQVFSNKLKYLQDIKILLTTLDTISDISIITDCNDGFKYYLEIDNNELARLKSIGLKHNKIKNVKQNLYWTDSKSDLYVEYVRDTYLENETFCFHDKRDGTGLFNNIYTGQCYSLMIDTYIKNKDEKEMLFKSIENNPIVSKKASWALKWINDTNPFAERLLAFCAVEGIFFSGSFCAIFWLKSRNLMPALTLSNQFISRDESLHCETCVAIYSKLKNKISEQRVHEIFREAYEIEDEFITKSLPVSLIGMNANSMKTYIKFITDFWLVKLGYSKLFNVKNPFSFMNFISLENKTNFFEKRVSEYSKVMDKSINFDDEEDF
ncbi:MAG: hypothetical protein RLZZ546_3387 [Bacteroidota bacterium]|jgi:ribonucleoside-diphosphate reductase beta chain